MVRRKARIGIAIAVSLLAVVVTLSVWVLQGGLENPLVPAHTQARSDWQDRHGPLIPTQWKQDGAYAAFSPGRSLLGCWSVAFAQVLAFHRLEPVGRVSYKTRQGRAVEEEFAPIRWERIVPRILPDTPEDYSAETARYCYDAAAVVQKDFGRGEYMDVARTG